MELGGKWQICRLREKERIESFRCGNPDLDDFLLNDSLHYSEELLANTYLLEIDGAVAGFNRFRRKRFVNSKRIRSYPAVKICRFAVSEAIKNRGIGSRLLNVIKMLFIIDNKAACRFITVDAYRDAMPFYEYNGFVPLQAEDAAKGTELMFFDLKKAV